MTDPQAPERGESRPMLHSIPIEDIIVDERFRKDIGDLTDLSASIRSHGLFHPVVIDRNFHLLAGERRLVACKGLGWSGIYVRFLDEVDDLTRREIELEENLHRKAMAWVEEDLLRAEIDRIKRAKYGSAVGSNQHATDPGWTQAQTAVALDLDQSQVSRSLRRVAAIELLPELANETSRNVADKKIERLISDLETREALLTRAETGTDLSSRFLLGDCATLLAQMPDASVDLIITDPPYGVDYDSIGGSAHRTISEYEDSPEAVLAMLRTVATEMRRVLKPSGHAYFFFGIKLWYQTFLLYERAGFEADPIPLVWIKNRWGTVNWDVRYAPQWEPIIFATNGQRKLAKARANVFIADSPAGKGRIHSAQKPVSLLCELIEQSSAPGETVLDPFAGSGSTLVAAHKLGRNYIGMERSEGVYNATKLRLLKFIETGVDEASATGADSNGDGSKVGGDF